LLKQLKQDSASIADKDTNTLQETAKAFIS